MTKQKIRRKKQKHLFRVSIHDKKGKITTFNDVATTNKIIENRIEKMKIDWFEWEIRLVY